MSIVMPYLAALVLHVFVGSITYTLGCNRDWSSQDAVVAAVFWPAVLAVFLVVVVPLNAGREIANLISKPRGRS